MAVNTGPLRPSQTAAAVELANAIAAAEQSGEYVDLADLTAVLGAPGLDPAVDSLAVWLDDRLVGYGLVPSPDVIDGRTIVKVKGGIHPDARRRGLGGPLLDWQLRRGRERADVIDVEVQAVNAGGIALLGTRGFRPVRYFSVMQRSLSDPVAAVPLPDGLTAILFDPQYDEALRLAHNEIFRDHWGVTTKDEDDWRTWFTGNRAFRAASSYLVLDGDRIAAYALAYEHPVDTEKTGIREVWIGQVGARREYRGRGVARAAMSAVLRAGQTNGYQRAGLGVDADNPTGASRLYESLGFSSVSTKILQRAARELTPFAQEE
ncbi:mycothiol synthase [Kribbella steppae]|uniref:Mycothiol synthase n=1 Tax=Kribbella steppae TaxID=2512223 RepID=A0A4V2RZ72_9ACTN|nr:GNAT family N-acetyltransferase [Kribbella steppae]TCO24575.1 mycothiol synthase [Kribbella steppae]